MSIAMVPPMTEPVIVPCLWMTGFEIEAGAHYVRIVGWVDLPVIGSDTPERRIVARLVMPDDSFRRLLATGRRQLQRASH